MVDDDEEEVAQEIAEEATTPEVQEIEDDDLISLVDEEDEEDAQEIAEEATTPEVQEIEDDDFISLVDDDEEEVAQEIAEEATTPEVQEIEDDDLISLVDDDEEEATQEIAEEATTPEVQKVEDDEAAEEELNYSKELIASEIGIDLKEFNKLFKDFIEEGEIVSNTIANAIQENNSQAWKQNAIKLKGMSDNMRTNTLSDELVKIINTSDSEVAKDALEKVKVSIRNISKIGD